MLSNFRHVSLFATPWTVALQAPLSMGCFRQEYWSGLPCPPPGHLPDPGMEPACLTSHALGDGFSRAGAVEKKKKRQQPIVMYASSFSQTKSVREK